MNKRIRTWWNEWTKPTGWSWEVWEGERLIDSGSSPYHEYEDARQLLLSLACELLGLNLEDDDVAFARTEDGGWAEWNEIEYEYA